MEPVNIEKIDSTRFTYANWVGSNGLSIFNVWDFDNHKPTKGWEIVGYCDSMDLTVRPGHGKYAMLLELVNVKDNPWIDKDELGLKIWLHLDYLSNDDFININKTN